MKLEKNIVRLALYVALASLCGFDYHEYTL